MIGISNSFKSKALGSLLMLGFGFMLAPAVLAQKDGKSQIRILSHSGKVQVKGKTTEAQAKTGGAVFAGDLLIIEQGGMVNLASTNGGATHIVQPGKYEYSQLEKMVQGNNAGVADRMVKFATERFADISQKAEQTRNNAMTGSIARMSTGSVPRLAIAQPDIINIAGDQVELSWYPSREANLKLGNKQMNGSTYLLQITDSSNKVIMEKTIQNDTAIVLNTQNLSLKPHEAYYWSVAVMNQPSTRSATHRFELLDAQTSAAIMDTASTIRQKSGLSQGMGYILEALYYEEHMLYGKALKAYNQAIAAEPQTKDYVQMLNEFRQRVYPQRK
jgi:hypothetical protein